jgi:mannose-1-phosphate guanylyltransferase
MKAVILAGGLGTRLQPYTFFIPKPMLPLGNKPLLEHIIEWLTRGNTINEIVVCVSYLHRTIEDYFEDGSRLGIKIKYARSDRPLATAGQLKTAEPLIDDTFVCVYGDAVYEFPINSMIEEHRNSKAFVTMALLSYKAKLKYGFIDLDEKSRIVSWRENPEI